MRRLMPAVARASGRARDSMLDPVWLDAALRSAAERAGSGTGSQEEERAAILDMGFAVSKTGMASGVFTGDQLASLASSLATLSADGMSGPDPAWGQLLLDSTHSRMGEMRGSSLAALAAACTRLRLEPGEPWAAALLVAVAEQLQGMNGADVGLLVGGLVEMGFRPPDEFLEVICLQTLDPGPLIATPPAQLTSLASSLAACMFRPPDLWLEEFVTDAIFHPEGFNSEQAARVLHALCMFQVLPDPLWLRGTYTCLLAEVETLPPELYPDVLWSVASMEAAKQGGPSETVNFRPPSSWMQLLLEVSEPHVRSGSWGKTAVIKALWAVALLRLRPPSSWLLPLLEGCRQVLRDPELDPLELLYLARCLDLVFNELSVSPVEAAERDTAAAAAQSPPLQPPPLDEYHRQGPPVPLATMVRDARALLQQAASTGQLPPDWRMVNLAYPPYAMPEAFAGEVEAAEEALPEDEDAAPRNLEGALFGPARPPRRRGRKGFRA